MVKRIEHLYMWPGIVLWESLYIVSFNPHNHFIRERILVPFYMCDLERLRYIPHTVEEDMVSNLGVSDPRSFTHSPLPCSFRGGNVEGGPGWRETGVRDQQGE